MTEREKILKGLINRILWMAIRYANGRSTYAPGIIRSVVKQLKELYPDFKLIKDITIKPPTKKELSGGIAFKDDYLYDLFKGGDA